MKFFSWLAEVLSDTTDKQGSTKRVVIFIFLTNFMVLLTGVVVANDWKFPEIPSSILYLVATVLGGMGFLATVDKGIAAFEDFKSSKEVTRADNTDTK